MAAAQAMTAKIRKEVSKARVRPSVGGSVGLFDGGVDVRRAGVGNGKGLFCALATPGCNGVRPLKDNAW